MQQRGLTLIELMIVIVIFVIVMLISAGFIFGTEANNNITVGINGITESRCIEGYKFVVGQDGNARQILDEFGKGVRCGNGLR